MSCFNTLDDMTFSVERILFYFEIDFNLKYHTPLLNKFSKQIFNFLYKKIFHLITIAYVVCMFIDKNHIFGN